MKFKTFLALFLSAVTFANTTIVSLPTYAKGTAMTLSLENSESNSVAPRYTYITSADIGVYPSSSKTTYQLNIFGVSSVTSVSGTVTLYKYSSTGSYVKVDSEKLNLKGSTILHTGYLKSSGSGKYKLEFKGTVNSNAGSESVTFRTYGSY